MPRKNTKIKAGELPPPPLRGRKENNVSNTIHEIEMSVMRVRSFLELADEYYVSEQVTDDAQQRLDVIAVAVTAALDEIRKAEERLVNHVG